MRPQELRCGQSARGTGSGTQLAVRVSLTKEGRRRPQGLTTGRAQDSATWGRRGLPWAPGGGVGQRGGCRPAPPCLPRGAPRGAGWVWAGHTGQWQGAGQVWAGQAGQWQRGRDSVGGAGVGGAGVGSQAWAGHSSVG